MERESQRLPLGTGNPGGINDQTVLPHLLRDNLVVLFVGINPGLRSAAVGHHFAGRSNRFWRFLFDSGLTSERLRGEEDWRLLEWNFGVTNIVARPSAAAAELTPAEFKEGALLLLERIRKYRPRIVAYLGKDIYRHLSNRQDLRWGLQTPGMVEGSVDFLLPNPSGLNRMPIPEQLAYYRELKKLVE
jgi:TDG/mug DNA glycosylase family protein